MQKKNEFSKALTEVEYILKYTDENLILKIPQSFFEFIDKNKDKEYELTINEYLPLENQNIREDTKNLMAFIYRNFFCDLDEKKEYDKILNKNQYKYDEKLKEKYSYENLFRKNKCQENYEIAEQTTVNMQIIEYKDENIFQKVFNKIKNYFNKLKK